MPNSKAEVLARLKRAQKRIENGEPAGKACSAEGTSHVTLKKHFGKQAKKRTALWVTALPVAAPETARMVVFYGTPVVLAEIARSLS